MTFFILSVEHKKQLGRKLRNDSLGNLNDDILIFLSETRNRLRLVSYCLFLSARTRPGFFGVHASAKNLLRFVAGVSTLTKPISFCFKQSLFKVR